MPKHPYQRTFLSSIGGRFCHRPAASSDPRTFVDRPVDTLVIDEAQLEPRLFRAVKAAVDSDRRPGRFVLTGSAHPIEDRLSAIPITALWSDVS